MTRWKLLITGFFTFWGTLAFFRVVGQAVEDQRGILLEYMRRKKEAEKIAARQIPVASSTRIEDPTD